MLEEGQTAQRQRGGDRRGCALILPDPLDLRKASPNRTRLNGLNVMLRLMSLMHGVSNGFKYGSIEPAGSAAFRRAGRAFSTGRVRLSCLLLSPKTFQVLHMLANTYLGWERAGTFILQAVSIAPHVIADLPVPGSAVWL